MMSIADAAPRTQSTGGTMAVSTPLAPAPVAPDAVDLAVARELVRRHAEYADAAPLDARVRAFLDGDDAPLYRADVDALARTVGARGHHSPALARALSALTAAADHAFGPPDPAAATAVPVGAASPPNVAEALCEGAADPDVLRVVFLAGAGGAGKSSVAKAMFGGAALKTINQDAHLERLLAAARVPLSNAGARYDLFNRARDLRNKELDHYGRRRLGLLVDSTGWDYRRIADPVARLRRLGYDCFMVFVHTSLDTALRRNRARAEAGGRAVPDGYVEDAWKGAQRNLTAYATLFGPKRFFVVKNDRDVSPAHWRSVVEPKLAKVGRKILAAPLTNPTGLKWLAAERASATLDAPPRRASRRERQRPRAAAPAIPGTVVTTGPAGFSFPPPPPPPRPRERKA